MAAYKQLDNHIKASAKAVEFVKAKNHFEKDIKICLDEWNVWNFQDIKLDSLDDLAGLTTFEMTSRREVGGCPQYPSGEIFSAGCVGSRRSWDYSSKQCRYC